MVKQNINWTKVFKILSQKGKFHIYISSQTSGYFIGSIVGYEENRTNIEIEKIPIFMFVREHFLGYSEEDVYMQCRQWLNNFMSDKGDYVIVFN